MDESLKKLLAQIFTGTFTATLTTEIAPQVASALFFDGSQIATAASGFASEECAPSETQFRIASMTKCFCAAAVLRLRDAGKLSLDDHVHGFLPTIKDPRWRAITIRDLLSMQSGLPTDDPWGDRLLTYTDRQLDEHIGSDLVFCSTPRSEFHYSNFGYMLLGKIISVAAGRSCLKYIEEEILRPLGMTRTGWNHLQSGWISGYSRGPAPFTMLPVDPTNNDGGVFAGLWSTTSDLGRWMAFMTGSSTNNQISGPLSVESVAELQTAMVEVPHPELTDTLSESIHYGYGLRTFSSRGVSSIGHSGGLPGYGTHFRWNKELRIGVVSLANSTYANVGEPCRKVMQRAVLILKSQRRGIDRLVRQRVEELLSSLRSDSHHQLTEIVSSNFHLDHSIDEFWARLKDIRSLLKCADLEKLLILPEPELGARIIVDGIELLSFLLSPGEGAKIQSINIIHKSTVT